MANILLVEDSKAQGEQAVSFLDGKGYKVIWAQTGTQAIKAAIASPPDIVLLDLELPDINGSEVCRWLKSNEATKGIPVIMLTAKSTLVDKVTGLETGADDYLAKPYEKDELNARIYAALRTKALRDELSLKNQQLEVLLERVRQMAITDPLTGIYNRRHFESVVEREFKRSARYGNILSCLMADIDYFKRINDEFGHQAGDIVLKEIASLIRGSLRQDVDVLARWGGEEFVVLMPQTGLSAARQAAARILSAISAHDFGSVSPGLRITASIGIATAPPAETEEKLIKTADAALYRAKETGRNRAEAA